MPALPATTVDFFLAGLESFMVRHRQGQHWAVTALWLGGRPDAAALTHAWEQLHARNPLLAAKLLRRWRGWRLEWETPGPPAAPPIQWHEHAESVDETDLIRERLRGTATGRPITTPLLLEVWAEPASGRHLLLLSWRHALLDGVGVNLLLEKLAAGGDVPAPPVPAPQVREPAARLFQRARPLMRRLHAMTRAGCLSAWAQSMAPPGAPDFRMIALDAARSAAASGRLRQLCGEFFQMPFYAAVAARALHRLHELRGWHSPEMHLHLPFQARNRCRDLIFGNHMGTLPLFLESAHLGTLESAVAHLQACYKDALKQGLPQASEALMTLSSHMPVGCFIPAVRLQNRGQICSLFHSHTGEFLPGSPAFAGAVVENVCTIPSVSSPPGLGVFFSSFGGRITATLAWREGGFSNHEVEALAGLVLTDLAG